MKIYNIDTIWHYFQFSLKLTVPNLKVLRGKHFCKNCRLLIKLLKKCLNNDIFLSIDNKIKKFILKILLVKQVNILKQNSTLKCHFWQI